MGEFSAAWLDLREAVDRRSRNTALAAALRQHMAGRPGVRVADLGCGTGANLRACAPLLGPQQHWLLLDNDAALLGAARDRLSRWADAATPEPGGLRLRKAGITITVQLQQADLAVGLQSLSLDLLTASALFDLASPHFIAQAAEAAIRQGAAFYTVLTYDGEQSWSPAHALDEYVRRAFNAHQLGDKGFGPAAGPNATSVLQAAFASAGYLVETGASPWVLEPGDALLLAGLANGIADAVAETGMVAPLALAAWRAQPRSAARTGHIDLLALPRPRS